MEQPAEGPANGRRGRFGQPLSLRQQLMAGTALSALVASAVWLILPWLGIQVQEATGSGTTPILIGLLGAALGTVAGWVVLGPIERRVTDLAIYASALARGDAVAPLAGAGPGALGDLAEALRAVATRLGERERQVRELDAHASRLDAPLREAAAQEERNRLARELHDTIKQQLFSIGVTAAAAEARWEADPPGARAAVGEIRALAGEAQVEMRALLTQLRPAPVATVGLLAALREQLDSLAYRAEVEAEADLRPLPDGAALAPGAEDALFRIAQEGLANIARHARARRVWVTFGLASDPARGAPAVELRLRDDGRGFDPGATGEGTGMGVQNMRARAAEIAGTLTIESRAGRGTELIVRVPLYEAPAFVEDEGIPVEQKERELRIASTLRIISSVASVSFFWSVIVVNRLDGLPGWTNYVALGLLGMSLGTSIAAEQLARRFRRTVGDAPEWRARLDRVAALSHLAEYLLSLLLVPEMLRIITFFSGPLAGLNELMVALAELSYFGLAIWAAWELVRAEVALTRVAGRWTTRAAMTQDRTRQITTLAMILCLLLGVAALAPGQVTFFPSSVADVVRTSLIGILITLGGIAAWDLIVTVARLRWTDDGLVAG